MVLKKMQVDVYSDKGGLHHVLIPKGSDLVLVPKAMRDGFSELIKRKSVIIDLEKPLIGASPSDEILRNLEKDRYHEQRSEIQFEEIAGGRGPMR